MKDLELYHIKIYGIVQGVGFRPTVTRHANKAGITGTVSNRGPYVEVFAEGTKDAVDYFVDLIKNKPPVRAVILKIMVMKIEKLHDFLNKFSIIESSKTAGEIFISPDIAICDECKKELYEKGNKRYLHPFINCTSCGPRLTILDSLPYDRERTSMKKFKMCDFCDEEYHNKETRRFDAQPVCCNECGPSVYLLDKDTRERTHTGLAAIREAKRQIIDGKIITVKGIGGYHLICDATNRDAVKRLRTLKNRPFKPFAVMMKDEETVKRECILSEEQEKILCGHQKPILLLNKKKGSESDYSDLNNVSEFENVDIKKGLESNYLDSNDVLRFDNKDNRNSSESNQSVSNVVSKYDNKDNGNCLESNRSDYNNVSEYDNKDNGNVTKSKLADNISEYNNTVGVMLPYAPVHLLLFESDDEISKLMPDILVATSGNVSGAPICHNEDEVISELYDFTDYILSNNRDINIRTDDTVMDFFDGKPYMVRRSRGYAPLPFMLTEFEIMDESENISSENIDEAENISSENVDESENISSEIVDDAEKPNRESHHKQPAVLGIGGELKNTFCIGINNLFYPSSYIGDLSDIRSIEVLEESIEKMEKLLECEITRVVCDMHPNYNSVMLAEEFAKKRNIELIKIQHHYAHILSCMAENDFNDKVIGISFDGTGFGEDGTVWGGEFLLSDVNGFERVASISSFNLLGGDRCSREGYRIAAACMFDLFDDNEADDILLKLHLTDENDLKALRFMYNNHMNSIKTTSVGRLFDGVAALLGITKVSTFEGEAAIRLQYYAENYIIKNSKNFDETTIYFTENDEIAKYFTKNGEIKIDNTNDIFKYLVSEVLKTNVMDEVLKERLAFEFHYLLAMFTIEKTLEISRKYEVYNVALSGGVFQNKLFLKLVKDGLQRADLKVLIHSLVPPNDGGIGLGQALYGFVNNFKNK
ncbi:MAG: carbamoyltransferase HypF [Lachnospiraceae bacterium]|nr:carbamoyltransferase HypF [Lachnospiraceae bacterium]